MLLVLPHHKKGHYIEDKWKKERREYLKLHIAVDVKSKQIISFRVTKRYSS